VGIRTKLVASLSAILVVLTVVLGAAFAVQEQQVVLQLKRDHLRHSAELAAGFLARSDEEDLQSAIDALNASAENGPRVRFMHRNDHSVQIHGAADTPTGSTTLLSVAVPLEVGSATPARDGSSLVAVEQLPERRTALLATLSGHIALGLLLTIVAVAVVAIVVQRLVVRPIQWLVSAADSMAQGENWDTIQPESRQHDEIGVLSNHLTDLSRRLADAVRRARHSSAHLVAEGVRRDMAQPLRSLSASLTILQATTAGDVDAEPQLREIGRQVIALRHLAERLVSTGRESRS